MEDSVRTIEDAKNIVRAFCEEREWDQFHNPKDLAIGICTEASELLELMRFKTPQECEEMMSNSPYRSKINDELADVFYFVLRFAQINKIDLYDVLCSKIRTNEMKYPVEKYKGSNRKYNQ